MTKYGETSAKYDSNITKYAPNVTKFGQNSTKYGSDITYPFITTYGQNIIQLIDEGMGDYHFYSDETSDIRRGRRPSRISSWRG